MINYSGLSLWKSKLWKQFFTAPRGDSYSKKRALRSLKSRYESKRQGPLYNRIWLFRNPPFLDDIDLELLKIMYLCRICSLNGRLDGIRFLRGRTQLQMMIWAFRMNRDFDKPRIRRKGPIRIALKAIYHFQNRDV